MRRLKLLLVGCILCITAKSQNPATTIILSNRNINLACGTACTTISAQVPHIKGTNSYVITNPAYVPFSYTTPGGTVVTPIYTDDTWSPAITPGFSFCYYGSTFNSLIMGSNSAISFDVSRAGTGSGYSIATGGTIPSTTYAPNMIFGPYHDIDPGLSSANKKIEWRVEGIAPTRRFIASYNDMPYFGSSCTAERATHQMVLYESTGIVEVYIKDKPFCTAWNGGRTILGMQNGNQTQAIAAVNKNATVWGAAAMDSCWRFIPSGGVSRYKSAQLFVNNSPVYTADTSTLAAGVLNLNFPNVCPTADSTAYVLRLTYGDCNGNAASDAVFTDTIFVKRDLPPTVTAAKTDATCTTTGSITLTGAGSIPPYEYSINNGTTWVSTNVFSNLIAGTYNIRIRKTGSTCIGAAQQVVITATNTLTFNPITGGSICRGASFTPVVTGNATSYSWSPTTGVSNPAIANPVLAPQATTTYTVTATLGTCTQQRTVTVTVFEGATANAGPDATILAGDVIQLQATASAGTYLWTPATGLSATNILNPVATPAITTTYTLNVTSPQGCLASDNATITVVPYCVKPMEAFTPNGDGINDLWLLTNGTACLTRISAQVFNRYGSKVYESNDYKNNWNGTYEGKPLPDGTYYYIISFDLINGKRVQLKGNLTILR
jgi:gliding motility-associated-like protein